MKTIPELRDSPDLPEAERTRAAVLADATPMPALARAWQILLKGTTEVEGAPDRRAAAEMILIRLCYAADLPTPGELVKQLSRPAQPASSSPATGLSGGPGGARAVAGGGVVTAAPAPSTSPATFRDVVALAAAHREARLHSELLHHVHLVRYAPPSIELRPDEHAPRDLAPRLAALLQEATGERWTIALSQAHGEPTLAEQAAAADAARRAEASEHPLVRAILEAFPGARIEAVHDRDADQYGLPRIDAVSGELQETEESDG